MDDGAGSTFKTVKKPKAVVIKEVPPHKKAKVDPGHSLTDSQLVQPESKKAKATAAAPLIKKTKEPKADAQAKKDLKSTSRNEGPTTASKSTKLNKARHTPVVCKSATPVVPPHQPQHANSNQGILLQL